MSVNNERSQEKINLKKKENIIIIALLVVMILAIIGVSYAAFSFSKQGSVPNKITTGTITMTYTESDNTISLGNALPTTDETGTTRLKDGEYFDFTVSSEITGEVNINYEISAKEIGEGTIDGSNIKLYLTRLTDDGEEQLMSPETYNEESISNTFTGRPSGEMSLYTSSMNSSESNNYRLRMYVDENYNPQGDGGNLTFAVQVNVYGKAGLSMEDRMMKERVSGEDFHTDEYKSSITSIVTKGDTIIPESATESWDISEKQNGSVIAYVEDDGTGSGTYKLTLGGESKIIANYDMSLYFNDFNTTKTIDLSYLDTSLTTDMDMMFASNIFGGSQNSQLEKIVFGDMFNTSQVTTMYSMFMNCLNLQSLDLSNFDTSNVTIMMAMFGACNKLTSLDLKSFDTSKVEKYNKMFFKASNLTEVIVTRDKWNIPSSDDIFNGSGVKEFTYV